MTHRSVAEQDRCADSSPTRNGAESAPPSGRLTPRRGRTLQRQGQFLGAYGASGLIGQAASAAGITRQAVLKWQQDPRFREAMARTRQDYVNHLAATRADLIRAGMQRFERHIDTLDTPALGAVAARRGPAMGSRQRVTRHTSARGQQLQQVRQQLRFLKAYAEYGDDSRRLSCGSTSSGPPSGTGARRTRSLRCCSPKRRRNTAR